MITSISPGAVVQRTAELRRILALPRRVAAVEDLTEWLTDELRTPTGTMRLWPVQALALVEVAQCRGGFLPIGVGLGKALISLLAPVVLDAQRPLLLVPAALREQTRRLVLPTLRQHWSIPDVDVRGYSELSIASGVDLLDDIDPDVVILDECHMLSSRKSARTRRFARWLREHRIPVVAMSGTVTKRSILDYWHLLGWTHGSRSMPLPSRWREAADWAAALDERHPAPIGPGALRAFAVDDETPREGYRRRLADTPGIVMSTADALGTSLQLRALPITPSSMIAGLLDRLRDRWEDPQGDVVMRAVDVWRLARQLALGFWYRWDPSPPADWLAARSTWRRYVRETLKHSRTLDSEMQVWRASELRPHAEWTTWRDVKDCFTPNVVATWVDDVAIDACTRWLRDDGIAWVEHIAFGERLAARAGVPYFGAGDERILMHRGPCIASMRAHGVGKNLQRWSRNLVVAPPTSGRDWEQLLGRTHRHGQQADTVVVDVLTPCEESVEALRQACADAVYLEETLGDRQRLLYCDLIDLDVRTSRTSVAPT